MEIIDEIKRIKESYTLDNPSRPSKVYLNHNSLKRLLIYYNNQRSVYTTGKLLNIDDFISLISKGGSKVCGLDLHVSSSEYVIIKIE